jgi:hypothetical protein
MLFKYHIVCFYLSFPAENISELNGSQQPSGDAVLVTPFWCHLEPVRDVIMVIGYTILDLPFRLGKYGTI